MGVTKLLIEFPIVLLLGYAPPLAPQHVASRKWHFQLELAISPPRPHTKDADQATDNVVDGWMFHPTCQSQG